MPIEFPEESDAEKEQSRLFGEKVRRDAVSITQAIDKEMIEKIQKKKFRGKLVAISLQGAGLIGIGNTMEELATEVSKQYGADHLWTPQKGGPPK